MSTKKPMDMKAFLQNQKSKKAKKKEEEQPSPANDAEIDEKNVVEEEKQEDSPIKTNAKEAGSDEEEEDEEESIVYGKIKETKADKKNKNISKEAYFEDQAKKSKPDAQKEQVKPKKTGEITFGGGKPTFGRNKMKGMRNEFKEGLDALEDDADGAGEAKNEKPGAENAADEGGRKFINLGASARPGGENRGEEESKRVGFGAKPKFSGKFNARVGGGDEDNNEGVVKTYDFSVALRGPPGSRPPRGDGDAHEEGKDGDNKPQFRRDHRNKNRDRDQGGQSSFKPIVEPGDGFEVVTRNKRGKGRGQKREDGGSSDSDDGFKPAAARGRGGRGRGGFYNSRRDTNTQKND